MPINDNITTWMEQHTTTLLKLLTSLTISYNQLYLVNKSHLKHPNNNLYDIMKVIDLQYITHCTNSEYQLITIHRADNTLIYIKPSKMLTKQLLKQKDKPKSIKTGVNQIHQASLLPNRVINHITSNLIKEWSLRINCKEDNKEDNRVQKEIIN